MEDIGQEAVWPRIRGFISRMIPDMNDVRTSARGIGTTLTESVFSITDRLPEGIALAIRSTGPAGAAVAAAVGVTIGGALVSAVTGVLVGGAGDGASFGGTVPATPAPAVLPMDDTSPRAVGSLPDGVVGAGRWADLNGSALDSASHTAPPAASATPWL